MKGVMSEPTVTPRRGELFRYVDLVIETDRITGTYELDGRRFVESVVFEGVGLSLIHI